MIAVTLTTCGLEEVTSQGRSLEALRVRLDGNEEGMA